jgi:hypothetical protein
MQRTAFGDMHCSIARTLDVAGEPWTPLVLRDLFVGVRRFDDLQRNLGVSRKVLLRHTTCGHRTHAVVTCSACNEPLHAREVQVTPTRSGSAA